MATEYDDAVRAKAARHVQIPDTACTCNDPGWRGVCPTCRTAADSVLDSMEPLTLKMPDGRFVRVEVDGRSLRVRDEAAPCHACLPPFGTEGLGDEWICPECGALFEPQWQLDPLGERALLWTRSGVLVDE